MKMQVQLEYRGFREETITFRDRRTGQQSSFTRRACFFEDAEGAPVVGTIPDGLPAPDVKRGQQVTVTLAKFEQDAGVTRCQVDSIKAK